MNEEGTQFLVDVRCFNEPLRWFPASKVYYHSEADLDKLCLYSSVLAAVSNDASTPYIFEPAWLMFIDRVEEDQQEAHKEHQLYSKRCRTGLVQVEILLPDNNGILTRAFVHPMQLRIGTADHGIFYLGLLTPMIPQRYVRRSVHLDADQEADEIDLKHLLDAAIGLTKDSDFENWLMRIQVKEETIQINYREHYNCDRKEIDYSVSYETARKVYRLVTILANTVNNTTTAPTLTGSLNAELELALCQFLIAKSPFIRVVQFKNACWRPLKQNASKTDLNLSKLKFLQSTCQRLRLYNVTVPRVFGAVAGMWCMPARSLDRFRSDLDVHIPSASLDCRRGKADVVRQFLYILNRYSPALSAAEYEYVRELLSAVLKASSEHPYRQRLLLMLEILQNTDVISSGGYVYLSKLAAHSIRFPFIHVSFPETYKHTTPPTTLHHLRQINYPGGLYAARNG